MSSISLEQFGRTKRGWLGVFIQEITPDIADSLGLETESGALVSSVHPEGPAQAAGVQTGDIVIEFDGKTIEDMRSLPRIVAETTIGKEVEVKVIRDGREKILRVTLGELEQAEENGLLAGNAPPVERSHSFASLGFTIDPMNAASREKYNLPEEANGAPLTGVVVTEVVEGSPAAERGLEPGDVIRRSTRNRSPVSDLIDGVNEVRIRKIILPALVRRGDRERFVAMPVE